MFKLQKHKSGKVGEKFDFQFSDFQAIKVPRGWDKLFVSISSHDTGKTIVKSGKTSVKNGICRWTETLRESVSISQEKGGAKELQGCLFRFAVAMGSSRSGILGEVTVNLAEYASSKSSVPLSLLLNKCNYGTSLQFKIQCLTPKSKYRDELSKQSNLHVEYGIDDIEIKSDASDGVFSGSMASMSGNHLESTSTSQADLSRDPSLSASDSRRSFDSIEASSGNDMFSPQNNLYGPVTDLIVRQDSSESQNSGPSRRFCATDDDNRSNHCSVRSRAAESINSVALQREEQSSNTFASPPHSNDASSKKHLEAAEVTIEELKAEARMWERNAKKLTVDVEVLRKEMSEQSRTIETLNMELSASKQECDGLNQEIEYLRSFLEESSKKQNTTGELRTQNKDMDENQKKLEEELRSYEESNANLTEQLQKTQESNVELLSILQELESIIETQKSEIENLSSQKLKLQKNESRCVDANTHLSIDFDVETNKVLQPTQDPDEKHPEGIDDTKLQLQQLQRTQEKLESTIRLLVKSVEEKDGEIEGERHIRTQALLDCESKWRLQVAAKEEEIMKLEANLAEAVKDEENKNLEVENGNETELAEEISFLKRKVEDLEKDCKELSEENLGLLIKLKQPGNRSLPPDALVASCCGIHVDNSLCTCGFDVRHLKGQLEELKHDLMSKESLVEPAVTSAHSQVQCLDHVHNCHELEVQLQNYKEKVVHLEDDLQKCLRGAEQRVEVHSTQQQIDDYETKETKSEDLQLVLPNENFVASSPNNMSHILFELHKLLDHALKIAKRNGHPLNSSVDNSICCFHELEQTCNTPLTCEEQLLMILDSLIKTNKWFEGECNRCRDEHAKDAQVVDNDKPVNLNANCISYAGPLKAKGVTEADLDKDLSAGASEIKALKSDNFQKEEEIEAVRAQLKTLEDQLANVHHENLMLQQNIQGLEREKTSSDEFLEELKKENKILSSNIESHISASKVLERLSSELGKGKEEVEQQLSDLEKENMQLSERISALEAQLRYLMDEKETCLLDLRHSESQSRSVSDEINRLKIEMETQKVDFTQQLQHMQQQLLEAQDECGYLKEANPKLQSTAENLIEECTSLQKFNEDLRRQNMEMHKCCTVLESKLRDTQAKFAECSERIEALEAEFLILVEEVSLKANSLNSELDSLVIEDRGHREKVMQENISLNDLYLEKVVEVENYQRELAHLIDQISVTHEGQETVASEAMHEVSVLRGDKAKLELSLQEMTGKFALSQSKLTILEAETEAKVKQLTGEVIALRKSQDILLANHEKQLVSLDRLKSNEENYKSVINGLKIDIKASEYERLQLVKEISSLKEQLQRTTLIQAELLDLKTSLSETKFKYERVKASLDLLTGDHEKLKTHKDSLVQEISNMQKSLLELEDCQHSKVALEEKVLRLEGDLTARDALCLQDAELKFELRKFKRANVELQRKIKLLEQDQEQLQQKYQAMHDQMKSTGKPADIDNESNAAMSSARDKKQVLEIPDVQNTDCQSKIQSLENELAEALETNDMYKAQLRRLLSENQNSSDTPKISGSDNDSDVRRQGINMLSMELELRDLREKYFQISLKYAEVEAQREELVLKLKSKNNKRSWFS